MRRGAASQRAIARTKLVTVVQVVPPSLAMGVLPSESRGATGEPVAGSLATGVAVPEPPPLEQVPLTAGAQTKSLPQSWSVLQGNCHLKAQVEMVVSTQLSGGVGLRLFLVRHRHPYNGRCALVVARVCG